MPIELSFRKTGKEIKQAVSKRIEQLQQRLDKRNRDLDRFMEDPKKVRSYIIRSSMWPQWEAHMRRAPSLYSKEDVSSEERQEINQLCRRVFEIEQEIHHLNLVRKHLDDKREFDLQFDDLVAYGFDEEIMIEG